MRCSCCNKNLSDYESTLRHPVTNEFLDTCNKCLVDTGIKPVEQAFSDPLQFDVDDDPYESEIEYIQYEDFNDDPMFLDDN